MKPPNNKRTKVCPYAVATALWSKTPLNGNPTKGTNEVMGMGTGSVTHQMAHKIVMADVQEAGPSRPDHWHINQTKTATLGPKIKKRFDWAPVPEAGAMKLLLDIFSN